MGITLQQLHNKSYNLRKAYAEGTLSKLYVKIVEDELPGWDWACVSKEGEAYALEMTSKIAGFYHEHGRYPSGHAKDPEEKKLNNWVKGMRQAKRDKVKDRTFYPSCEQLAKDLGCPDMFEPIMTKGAREERALEMTRKVAEFYHKNGRYPRQKKDIDRKLGAWLCRHRMAKRGKGKCMFYPSCEELAKQLGCPAMFESKSYATGSIDG